jgi:hypothetical protein
MRRIILILGLLLYGRPHLLEAQAPGETSLVANRAVTVTAGVGNAMGWFGAQGERYFAKDRVSGFVGVGYTPSIDAGDPSGATFAAGVRGFTPGGKHRGFAALCICQIFVVRSFVSEEESGRLYGPGLELGYQFVSQGGFTLIASLGVGYAPGVPQGEIPFTELLGLGLGYTWRSRR